MGKKRIRKTKTEIKREEGEEREDPSSTPASSRRTPTPSRRTPTPRRSHTPPASVEPASSLEASEDSSSASGIALPYPGLGDTPSDQSAVNTPDEEPLAASSGIKLQLPTGGGTPEVHSDPTDGEHPESASSKIKLRLPTGRGTSDVPSDPTAGESPESASSGIKLRFPTGRGTSDAHSDPTAAEHPESNTPSVGGVSATSLSPHDIAGHSRFAGKRLPGYPGLPASRPTASLRPASLLPSLARSPVREDSAPLSSSDEQASSVSPEEEYLGHFSQFGFTAEGTPELLSEGEMSPRRGPRVPATPHRPGHSPPGSSSIPDILPETRANREKRARERQSRERQSQEEARDRLAREEQAREQQAREARPPPPAQHVPDLPEPAGASNANAIAAVIDYLAKKGYSRTEAMLRMESANQEIDGRPLPQLGEDSRPKTRQGFDLLKNWVEENLDLYKPELRRVLWPLFVYSFFNMVTSFYPQDAKSFFEANKNMFLPEHNDDIRHFEPISLPEHLQDNSVAKIYRTNKYRIVLSNPAYTNLLQFLETKDKEGGSVMNAILSSYCSVKTLERTADERFSFAAMLNQIGASQSYPAEDEGIPGHHPGSAYTGDNPAMAGTLPRLKLGKLQMEQVLEEDVRAELEDEDRKETQPAGRSTLIQEFDDMIKREDDDEAPTRADIPYPSSTARDVHIEVKKVMEHRDRFKIEGRTGGVGPGVSVCMFTFHNTFDTVNCIEFTDDSLLVAAGFQQSYIRVWTLDGKNLPKSPEFADQPDANSRRLIGHSGAVFAVQFPPCAAIRDNVPEKDRVNTGSRWLLSSSADKTVRLWSLDTWQCMVVYKGHDRPVWDLRFGPFGHYFVTGGSDRTARLWVTDQIRQQRIFVGHDQDVDCVCFHPNSAYIFTASSDHTVRMWAVSTGNAVRMFTGHTGNITSMECSRDGKILASADDQGTIILWDLAPGRLLKRMRGHGKGGIWSLSWSVESTVLVSGGADGTVRLWDIAGPQEAPGRVIGEGGGGAKIDAGSNPTGQSKKKKGKETDVTADQISAFPTKKSPVYKVKFTNMNLVLAAGAYLPTP